jgi:hypothetical protein
MTPRLAAGSLTLTLLFAKISFLELDVQSQKG